jgi:hypothetical protein
MNNANSVMVIKTILSVKSELGEGFYIHKPIYVSTNVKFFLFLSGRSDSYSFKLLLI